MFVWGHFEYLNTFYDMRGLVGSKVMIKRYNLSNSISDLLISLNGRMGIPLRVYFLKFVIRSSTNNMLLESVG